MVAIGRLSLSYSDLFCYDLDDLDLMLEGKDYELKQMWEASRLAGYLALIPNLKKGSQNDPKKVWRFGWEENKTSKKKYTSADFDKYNALYQKVKNGKFSS
jgi:hypothetical protein